jgi:hypothetical protein
MEVMDIVVAATLFFVYVFVLVKTAHPQGYARDEGFYFHAAESYAGWFERLFREPSLALERRAVDGAFTANHEHPVFVKSLFSLSWMFLHKRSHLFAEEGTSFRFPGMCFAGLTLSVLYLWGTEARGRRVGLAAALLFALVPTTFYHAHLDCFDVPIACMWLLTAYAYWKSLREPGLRWAVAAGVLFGLTLNTKHNSWFLPFAVAAHLSVIAVLRRMGGDPRPPSRFPWGAVSMLVLGPMVFVGTWPWLWFDTWKRFLEYARFHLGHEYYNMEFLGTTYFQPPFPRSYAWLMTAATVPVITLVLFLVGLAFAGREQLPLLKASLRGAGDRTTSMPGPDAGATEWLWVIGLLVSYAPWLSTGTPIFGGTKHWLTAYPFLALFAGMGFVWVLDRLTPAFDPRVRLPVAMTAAVAMLIAPAVETFRAHPWGLSAYTPLVGGAPGAASLGLNRGFWGYTTGSVTDVLNARVPRGGSVYVHDTAWDAWRMLQRDGRLRGDIRGVFSPAGADAAIYHHEQHMAGVEYQIWMALGTVAPAAVRGLDGVPIVWVYLRPR